MVSQSEMPSSNFPERGFLCQQNPLSGNLDSQEPPTEKSVHHILCSAHQKCCRAHFQGGGSCASGTASPEIWTRSEKRAVSGGKTKKKLPKFFLRLQDTYKKYILQKNWVKTAIPALSSGQNNLQVPIWGCHRQLDDQHLMNINVKVSCHRHHHHSWSPN